MGFIIRLEHFGTSIYMESVGNGGEEVIHLFPEHMCKDCFHISADVATCHDCNGYICSSCFCQCLKCEGRIICDSCLKEHLAPGDDKHIKTIN